ncbi:hypothetical protein OSH39_24900, partial [Mycobacterium ulcerans]|nr:hypothetical protein [Mycobacterium ulcerans]MEB3911341.1 hypothetical protein [Mycobacterium ulcerans]MEB3921576.1 hypothetical protein [Mycobacterium ulcerans]MEB3938118.1 hypothetical protein [Mycobacterium ulcerans]MEB3975452.1 hypothetical protein [Mycobacterium ulcerans]
QPPPRPPQSTIPQLTSLLINNAGALVWFRPAAADIESAAEIERWVQQPITAARIFRRPSISANTGCFHKSRNTGLMFPFPAAQPI